jgi:hypothetical protein
MTNSSFTADHATPDGDAWNNRDEYVSDTDPKDNASGFPNATNTSGQAVQTFTVSPTSTGRLYDIFWKTNLSDGAGWTAVGLNQAGSGAGLVLTVTNQVEANFYRTGVTLP